MQLHRSMQEPQCNMSYSSITSQLAGKTPKCGVFRGDSTQKREVSFKQWVFDVKSVMQSYTEATLREGRVHSLWGAKVDLVRYLGSHYLISNIINMLELVYGTLGSFDILMQNFCKLQQGRMEKVPVYMIQLEEVINTVQQEYPNMMSASKVQKHLHKCLFHELGKQL